jgi:hypothetical protein
MAKPSQIQAIRMYDEVKDVGRRIEVEMRYDVAGW